MKAYRAEDPRGVELLEGRQKRRIDRDELVVDRYPDSLKRVRRRVDPGGVPVPRGYRTADHLGQRSGPAQGARAPGRHEGPYDAEPMGLLSKVAHGTLEHLLGCRLKPAGGRYTRPAIHPHVRGTVGPERESTLRIVELER